ncbi:BQ5605_C035g11431 [Microbotryum silenes-dioicae]|uniref:BQ5605_C035g11431 protein n=1 Tax=Microbotryum silenes-dioicae TaxID=796604 RepID=A0A2X0PHH1_9BASI|nr:BQ5605_C035g11431 [Microbotryum silenes-dioicae]
MFLGTENKVYIVDKTENNKYDLSNNSYRSMDVITNTFCAGGNSLGNGSWINIGGNQAITTGGTNTSDGTGAYSDYSGRRTVRVLTPSDDGTDEWYEDKYGMPINRWYPYIETLETGAVLILGVMLTEPSLISTSEFWPTRGDPVNSTFLANTQPANLYPLSWLLPNGLVFMQADWQTQLLNYTSGDETALPNITIAQKTYPSSGATAMLPLTLAKNYTVTLLFCGGMTPERDDWDTTKWNIAATNTSSSCVYINPEDGSSATWKNDDDLPENRGMGNFIILPDERLLLLNGVAKGSAGYGWTDWAVNQSYGQDPVLRPAYYNASAPSGSRFSTEGLPSSSVGRLYHSSATLLVDGSVFIAGSNPNADVITDVNNATYVYKTEYRSEIFYPSYYDSGRPVPSSLPRNITYGGDYFQFDLPRSSLNGSSPADLKVSLIRTGFSTHAMNMGMKYIQLRHSYTSHSNGSATIYVAQVTPNPRMFQPGPALLFVTVNGIPSTGKMVMVGNGVISEQPVSEASTLPGTAANVTVTSTSPSTATATATPTATAGPNPSSTSSSKASGAIGASALLQGLIALVGGWALV